MIAAVTFSDVQEFFDDLDKDRDVIARSIVRVTKVREPYPDLSISRLRVEAAYLVDGEIVRFRRVVGDLWGMDRDDDVIAEADRIIEEIEQGLRTRGIEIRAGMLEGSDAR